MLEMGVEDFLGEMTPGLSLSTEVEVFQAKKGGESPSWVAQLVRASSQYAKV